MYLYDLFSVTNESDDQKEEKRYYLFFVSFRYGKEYIMKSGTGASIF